jgi:SpoVK/Ycf46/Vps4 family AAA+-type ATPase
MGEVEEMRTDLAQLARLSLAGGEDDVRLYVARLVRKYRKESPELAEQLNGYLRQQSPRGAVTRKVSPKSPASEALPPADGESNLTLLRRLPTDEALEPLLTGPAKTAVQQLIAERRASKRLLSAGLHPSRSAIFGGPPGVGKTMTARWVAQQLGVPLFVLDLAAVMSSLLGHSGNNLRAALNFAKTIPCVVLLDEIDAIAKSRTDESDIGELKRLVTVILQEVDDWPVSGLLLAATNHPELIDRALWRRFDHVVEFDMPEHVALGQAVDRFLGKDKTAFERWSQVLTIVFKDSSFSDIEREVNRFRRTLVLGDSEPQMVLTDLVQRYGPALDKSSKRELAVLATKHRLLSQNAAAELTGVSRDTIRKDLDAMK